MTANNSKGGYHNPFLFLYCKMDAVIYMCVSPLTDVHMEGCY